MAAVPLASEAAEAKELNLVSKVELRIALADSDAKLEKILGTYLAPLLLKLSSEHVTVRDKVSSIVSISRASEIDWKRRFLRHWCWLIAFAIRFIFGFPTSSKAQG